MKKLAIFISIIGGVFIIYKLYFHYYTPAPKQTLPKIDYIYIEKQKRKMTIYSRNVPLKTYNVALGFNPIGHKEKEGDGKTPEGSYKIINKNPKSGFHLSLKISYPNAEDKKQAQIKKISPGCNIMIHGIKNGLGWIKKWHTYLDWTLGCIAITNHEIEEIYPSVAIGTAVKIVP